MTGIILMTIGIIIFIVGIIIYNSSKKIDAKKVTKTEFNKQNNEVNDLDKIIEMAIADGVLTENEKKLIKQAAIENNLNPEIVLKNAEKRLSEVKTDSETELIDYKKKKGDDFEKYIAQKFNKKYFTIKEWAGDKYVNGVYANTTTQPDLLLETNFSQKNRCFSVECKWRQYLYKGGVEFGKEDQFKRYKNYEETKKIPVFLAIGVGGKASAPENLYIVPLKAIKSNFIHITEMKKYEKKIGIAFYYDIKTGELR